MRVKFLLFFRRIFLHGKDGPQNRQQKNHAADVKRPFHRGRDLALGRGVGDVQPIGEQVGQRRGDDRTDADEESLHGKSLGPLFVRQHVADERPERLHGDVDGAVHHP